MFSLNIRDTNFASVHSDCWCIGYFILKNNNGSNLSLCKTWCPHTVMPSFNSHWTSTGSIISPDTLLPPLCFNNSGIIVAVVSLTPDRTNKRGSCEVGAVYMNMDWELCIRIWTRNCVYLCFLSHCIGHDAQTMRDVTDITHKSLNNHLKKRIFLSIHFLAAAVASLQKHPWVSQTSPYSTAEQT